MPTFAQKKELVKLRVLAQLSEPAAVEFGMIQSDINDAVHRERGVTMDVLLADMVRDGLIERRIPEQGRQAKPYFITQAGKQYLDQESSRALFPEVSKKKDWSIAHSAHGLQEVFVEKLHSLPEFRQADEIRIQEVGKVLAELAMGKSRAV